MLGSFGAGGMDTASPIIAALHLSGSARGGAETGFCFHPGGVSPSLGGQTCPRASARGALSFAPALLLFVGIHFSAVGKPIIQLFTYCLMVVLALICLFEGKGSNFYRFRERI